MGRSRLIPFVVEYVCSGGHLTSGEYHRKYCGKPGLVGLTKHVETLQASMAPGGVNYHPALSNLVIVSAVLKDQRNGGTVVAEWMKP